MRKLLTATLAVALLAGPAGAQCLRPAEQNALDVTWLKSQLMVTSLSCQKQDQYNAFIRRFQPEMAAQDRAMNAYFTRTGGRRAAAARDDYVTQLANSQSQTSLKQGTQFCDRNVAIFDEVMALRDAHELGDFAAAKGIVQPINATSCTGLPEPVAPTRSTAAPKSKAPARHR